MGLEVSRVWFRTSIRTLLLHIFVVAGIFTHSTYLVLQANIELLGQAPLSSWHDWCLLAAWFVAVIYFFSMLSDRDTIVGWFLMPIVLLLIVASILTRDLAPFSTADARSVWNIVHGISLLFGTVTVSLGFVGGLMYLLQSRRLKHKLGQMPRFKLPSLEWLQNKCELGIVVSSLFLGVGLISGFVLNSINRRAENATLQWNDPVVLSSAVMVMWLVSAAVFHLVYRPARRGRKVAYVVVTSFIFLALELTIVLATQHGSNDTPQSERLGNIAEILREVWL